MTNERPTDEATLIVDRLVVHVSGYRRLSTPDPGIDFVEVDLTVRNPTGSPGATRRLPAVEVQDGDGSAYEAVDVEGIAEPVLPTEEASGRARFRVPERAGGLEFVIAPGSDEEARVALAPAAP